MCSPSRDSASGGPLPRRSKVCACRSMSRFIATPIGKTTCAARSRTTTAAAKPRSPVGSSDTRMFSERRPRMAGPKTKPDNMRYRSGRTSVPMCARAASGSIDRGSGRLILQPQTLQADDAVRMRHDAGELRARAPEPFEMIEKEIWSRRQVDRGRFGVEPLALAHIGRLPGPTQDIVELGVAVLAPIDEAIAREPDRHIGIR